MQKEVIVTKDMQLVTEESEEIVRLHYAVNAIRLTKDSQVVYEIAIEKWKEGRIQEREETGGITFDVHKAVDFLEVLWRNQVTPLCLLEVTDDCFCDRIISASGCMVPACRLPYNHLLSKRT